jgi:hypothetical protein
VAALLEWQEDKSAAAAAATATALMTKAATCCLRLWRSFEVQQVMKAQQQRQQQP